MKHMNRVDLNSIETDTKPLLLLLLLLQAHTSWWLPKGSSSFVISSTLSHTFRTLLTFLPVRSKLVACLILSRLVSSRLDLLINDYFNITFFQLLVYSSFFLILFHLFGLYLFATKLNHTKPD